MHRSGGAACGRYGSHRCSVYSASILLRLLEHLNAVVTIINHINVALAVYSHIERAVELPVPRAGAAPGVQERPILIELADLILGEVGNVDIVLSIGCDGARINKIIGRAGTCCPLCYECAVGIELLDARVAPIGDIDHALAIDRDIERVVELTVASAALAPFCQKFP